jgi:hypothetical protein
MPTEVGLDPMPRNVAEDRIADSFGVILRCWNGHAGEFSTSERGDGAEGATSPEPLRQARPRSLWQLWSRR